MSLAAPAAAGTIARVPLHRPGPGLDLVVPAYVHPAVDPGAWERLTAWAPLLRAVVLNVHDGPGEEPDPSYPPVVEALQAAGVRTLGYVDSAYGERPPGGRRSPGWSSRCATRSGPPSCCSGCRLMLERFRRTYAQLHAARSAPPRPDAVRAGAPAWEGPERRSRHPLSLLTREHDRLCVEACDPWEVAAGLETAGVDDRRARAEYAVASVFDLAAEMYQRVPRRPPARPAGSDPWARPLHHHLLRGVVTALPAVAYLAALHLLGARTALVPLLAAGVVAAAASQVFSALDHLLLGRLERPAAARG